MKNNQKRIELTACFRKLDILVFRSVINDFVKVPVNVSKITLNNLELLTRVGSSIDISGSIGNITVSDLACTNLLRQSIFTLGEGMKEGVALNRKHEKAFNFKLVKKHSSSQQIDIQFASAYYVHNPSFLSEILLCVGDYKHYAIIMAKSLQLAASDMAKSLMTGKANNPDSLVKGGSSGSILGLDFPDGFSGQVSTELLFTVNIDSPVVVFPKNAESNEFLVGHLGMIHIRNDKMKPGTPSEGKTENIKLDIQRINLSMLNLNEKNDVDGDCPMSELINKRSSDMLPLLDNTDLFVQVKKTSGRDGNLFNIYLRINTEIKLFLSVPVYQQILSTLKYSTDTNGSLASSSGSVPSTPLSSAASSQTSLSISASSER